MRQQVFERKYESVWQMLEDLLAESKDPEALLPGLYRQTCYHLSVAKSRRYTASLIQRLNNLVTQSHHRIYGNDDREKAVFLRFLAWGFPNVLHRNQKYVWFALLCFLLPGITLWLLCFLNEDMIYSVMDAADVSGFEDMYDPEKRKVGRERDSATDISMFGFYIWNNIGIAFKAFAGGILFGLGSLYVLIFNGVFIGAAAGHITHVGYIDTFYSFVVGHGAFELTAIVYSGAAGLRLGMALIAPGPFTRVMSLKYASEDAVKIIYGSGLMLLIAAFIEAFWSSSSLVPSGVKYAIGGVFWIMVIAYSTLLGRDQATGPPVTEGGAHYAD